MHLPFWCILIEEPNVNYLLQKNILTLKQHFGIRHGFRILTPVRVELGIRFDVLKCATCCSLKKLLPLIMTERVSPIRILISMEMIILKIVMCID